MGNRKCIDRGGVVEGRKGREGKLNLRTSAERSGTVRFQAEDIK